MKGEGRKEVMAQRHGGKRTQSLFIHSTPFLKLMPVFPLPSIPLLLHPFPTTHWDECQVRGRCCDLQGRNSTRHTATPSHAAVEDWWGAYGSHPQHRHKELRLLSEGHSTAKTNIGDRK